MPKISLVVCLYKERDLLERLLQHAEGCYDDLVVVHDGPEVGDPNWKTSPPSPELAIDWACVPPDAPLPAVFQKYQSAAKPDSLREFVEKKGGRLFEHPRVGSLEGQSPFAWWAAKHDWILRLDADEFPSEELKQWLINFRSETQYCTSASGYTCIWPFFDGNKPVTTLLPRGRLFLFNKWKVRYFGLTEQIPISMDRWEAHELILCHQPKRKSYGLKYLFNHWRKWAPLISETLELLPTDLPRWQWGSAEWPEPWLTIRKKPILTSIKRLVKGCIYQFQAFRRAKEPILWEQVIACGLHGAAIPFYYYFYHKKKKPQI